MRKILDQARLEFLKNYIVKHVGHLDTYMRPMIDPAGKRILVIGSGWGTETYWALKRGASYVVGIDPAPRYSEPLESALGEPLSIRFLHHQCTLAALPTDRFDAIISNNVFEHVFDIVGTLSECRRFMPSKGNRLHIFTDPLFYSSSGAHLPIDPWEHLRIDEQALKKKLPADANWGQYKNGLNRMTITSFLDAVRNSGMAIERLSVVPDRNRARYQEFIRDTRAAPMDALIEGIACSLMFPENV